jgi:WD40 repeat protein
MRSRFCALCALLATAALAAADKCDDIKLSAVPAANKADPSAEAGNQKDGVGQAVESARLAGRQPNPGPGSAPRAPENWELAATLAGHKDMVKSLAFSPDGKRLLSASLDGEIKVWDKSTRKELASIIAHERFLTTVVFSPSGEMFASAGDVPGVVKVWDARTLKLRITLSYPHPIYCLAFSRDSELIAGAGEREVHIWNVRSGERNRKLAVEMWPITGLAFSRDACLLYVGGFPDLGAGKVAASTGIVRVWDYSTGAKLDEIEFSYPVDGIDLSTDGHKLAVRAVALHVYDVAIDNGRFSFTKCFSALEQQSRGSVPIFQEQFRKVVLSPDGKIVAGAAGTPGPLAADAGHVALFALRDGHRIAQLQSPRPARAAAKLGEHDIGAVAFSPDGRVLVCGGDKRVVELWMARTAK